MVTARARSVFVCLGLVAKQFKLTAAIRTKIFIDRHLYSSPFSKAFKNTLGTCGTWVSAHVLRQLKEQKL